MEDGSYILLIQINLDIYLQKCLVTNYNKMKCKVVFKDTNGPKKRILESHINQDKFLIYKTDADFQVLIF